MSRTSERRSAARRASVFVGAAAALGIVFAGRARAASGAAEAATAPSAATSSSTTAAASASAVASAPIDIWAEAPGDLRNPRAGLDPLPSVGRFLTYSVGLPIEALLDPGAVCAHAVEHCMIGGGAGVAFGGAYRNGTTAFGAVWEVTFHDSHSIYQRGVLEQLRAEWSYHPHAAILFDGVQPFLYAGGGLAVYGDNWAVATFGPSGSFGAGLEFEMGVKLSATVSFAYHPVYFRPFQDASGTQRPAGIVHFLGLNFGLELREPL